MDYEKAIDEIAARYAAKGYHVVARPRPEDLPPFARDFKIQVVGRRQNEGVLVAVKRDRDEFSADPEMQRYATVAEGHPEWRFDFVLLDSRHDRSDLRGAQEPSMAQIEKALGQAEELGRAGFLNPGLITAWSAFEAVLRMRIRAAGESAEGSSSRGLVNELVSSGIISLDEFAEIEQVNQARNEVVHGFVRSDVRIEAIEFLVRLAWRLVGESEPSLVNIDDAAEAEKWSKRLGVTLEQLGEIVQDMCEGRGALRN